MNTELAQRGIQEFGGLYLPAHEKHLIEWMRKKNQIVEGRQSYQLDKINRAMAECRQFRGAIDVGAHCGLWSMQLARKFERVYAFEPVALHRECWHLNMRAAPNATLYPDALGEQPGTIAMHTTDGSSGDSWVQPGAAGDIPLNTIDSIEFSMPIDFIKLDCEGYELFALRGGEALLRRDRPTVLVEQKPGRAQKFGQPEIGAVDFLRSLGATLRWHQSGDYCMTLAWA